MIGALETIGIVSVFWFWLWFMTDKSSRGSGWMLLIAVVALGVSWVVSYVAGFR